MITDYARRMIRRAKKILFGPTLPIFSNNKNLFENKKGLEVGGPSVIFQEGRFLPVYKYASIIDGVNFSAETVWEGKIQQGNNYKYADDKIGYQYICEGTNLQEIKDASYDFVLSCHNLEHFANPLKAVQEWSRVLKQDGTLLLVLPHPKYTFDHKRPITTIEHLIKDFENDTREDDMTHLEEILRLHDLSRNKQSGDLASFKELCLKNVENRCIHHHVFSSELLAQIFSYFNYELLGVGFADPFHLIAIGKKLKSA
ncbi:Methyltransferase domain-containing protein [Chitinophaga sp. CF118]|uniref:class I SAM-dependent methyltransferase n=1 Tax=Chitinophaga sp. CF118 TaxID=1884367 RepID=UPI0008EDB84C|nr:class I SAM-dependent methyltransferase [Chitinophaga sp. CF118]SFE27414.1 Methyltransferase domain-containing protein [Chitinophaga sp. CF118]